MTSDRTSMPVAELAAAARDAPLIREARSLAGWVGARRPVTGTGVLRPADALDAARAMELYPGEEPRRVRSARELARLHRVWVIGLSAGILAVDGRHVGPGPAHAAFERGDDDVAALEAWERVLGVVFRVPARCGPGEDVAPDDRLAAELARTFIYGEAMAGPIEGTLTTLYAAGRGMTLPEVAARFARIGFEAYGSASPALAAVLSRCLTDWLVFLAGLGVVELGEDDVRRTPLGMWAVGRRVAATGGDLPEIPDLSGIAAEELLGRLVAYDLDGRARELAAWARLRTAPRAARELLGVARTGDSRARGLVFSLLESLADGAVPAVRAVVGDPVLRPYAVTWLDAHGHDPGTTLSRAEISWMTADACATLLGEPESLAARVQGLGPREVQERLVDDMGRVDHPRAADVLRAIGSHHPDETIAKAARRAAFRARSRRA